MIEHVFCLDAKYSFRLLNYPAGTYLLVQNSLSFSIIERLYPKSYSTPDILIQQYWPEKYLSKNSSIKFNINTGSYK